MIGNLASGTEPNAVVSSHVFEEPHKSHRPRRPPNEAVMQSNAHDLWTFSAFSVKHVETIDQYRSKSADVPKPL